MSDLKPEQNYAAEQLQDAIEEEEAEAPKADVQSDYDRSKKFSAPAKDSDAVKSESIQ